MDWRIPSQTMSDENITDGSSLNSSVLDYGAVLDNHFAQASVATEVGSGQTSLVMWGSLDRNAYYPLTNAAGTVIPASLVVALQAAGTPARYVYVEATQTINDVQELTIWQTGA